MGPRKKEREVVAKSTNLSLTQKSEAARRRTNYQGLLYDEHLEPSKLRTQFSFQIDFCSKSEFFKITLNSIFIHFCAKIKIRTKKNIWIFALEFFFFAQKNNFGHVVFFFKVILGAKIQITKKNLQIIPARISKITK